MLLWPEKSSASFFTGRSLSIGQLFEHGTRAASIDLAAWTLVCFAGSARRDANEKAEIQKAVAEWADRDTVAAHFAYTNSYLCSEDRGVSAGSPSIFDAINRHGCEPRMESSS